MNLKKNLSYNLLLSISQILFPILTIPYLTRIIEPANIGIVGIIDSLAYFFVVIADFGVTSYGIREIARNRNDKDACNKIISELVFLHMIAFSITMIIYMVSVAFLFQRIQDYILILFSIVFLLSSSFTLEWYFWGKENFKYITLRSILIRILGVIAIFLLVKQNDDYVIYYGVIVLSAALNAFFNISIIFKETKISFKNINWKQHIPKVFTTYLISLFFSVTLFLDSVFIGIVSTTMAVSFYAYAMKVIRISSSLITDTMLVFYPMTVALLHDKNQSELQNAVIRSSQLILLTAIPLSAGIFLLSDEFTGVYFGNSFISVSENLKILAIIPLLKSLSLYLNRQLLMPYDKEKLVLKSLIFGVLIFIPSVLILSFLYADKGAAIAVVLSELSVLLMNYHYVKKYHLNIVLIDKQTFFQALAGVMLFIPVIYLLDHTLNNDLLKILSSVSVCVIIYFLFLSLVLKNDLLILVFNSLKKVFINLK